MGNYDRFKRHQEAKENAGKPLGGDLDRPEVTLRSGQATLSGLGIQKPLTQGGKAGLCVDYQLETVALGGAKLVLEVTLHQQKKGPLKAKLQGFSNTLGQLEQVEVFTPADDDQASSGRSAFIPFEAIEVDEEGTLSCFARVRVLEAARGALVAEEVAFELSTG